MLCLFLLAFVTGAMSQTATTMGGPTHHPRVTIGTDLTVAFTLAFNAVDLDHNGQIDVGEFDKTFVNFDTNHDFKLTLQEYMAGTKTDQLFAKEVFKLVDHNDDGVLTTNDINRVFMMYDKNHNGVIDIKEFLNEYNKLLGQIMKALPTGYTFQQLQPTVTST